MFAFAVPFSFRPSQSAADGERPVRVRLPLTWDGPTPVVATHRHTYARQLAHAGAHARPPCRGAASSLGATSGVNCRRRRVRDGRTHHAHTSEDTKKPRQP